ncbi:MAG TPA: hypothetical protein VFZ87_05580 [Gemmatimonadales bacterium]
MRSEMIVIAGSMLLGAPLAAQDNPFALTGGSVKTAYIVYDVSSKDKQAQGASYEIGVAADRMMMRMVTPFEAAGKKDTARFLVVATKDSQYSYHSIGSAGAEGEVSPTLRAHLGRAYAALDAAGKARFRQNAKLAAETSGSNDADAYITLIGEKGGTETIAGHRCDVYRTRKSSACVIPNAPMVMLRWQDGSQGLNLVAKKVSLNGPLPPALAALPKGVSWKKTGPDDAEFISNVWALKKQTDPEKVPPATLSQFAVRYLASPEATKELREMSGGAGGEGTETGEADPDSAGESGS